MRVALRCDDGGFWGPDGESDFEPIWMTSEECDQAFAKHLQAYPRHKPKLHRKVTETELSTEPE